MKKIELTLPGRPVPLARSRFGRGRVYSPTRNKVHRESLALLIALKMREKGIKQFDGPVGVIAEFDYGKTTGKQETRLTIYELSSDGYKDSRADLDNLIKMALECLQDSGLVKDDAQIARMEASKLK